MGLVMAFVIVHMKADGHLDLIEMPMQACCRSL